MNSSALNRWGLFEFALALCVAGALSPFAQAIPSFQSIDNRLPNPDRSYEMVGGTVQYPDPRYFAIYDLEFSPNDPSQLNYPTRNPDGSLEFDSTFNIKYRAVVGISTQPPYTISGFGSARARGFAPASPDPGPSDGIGPNPQVFDTELVELNLFALSPIPEVMIRESPSIRSIGVTIREDECPVCLSLFTRWRVSSFFDIATEITIDGGNTWTPASDFIHVEQAPDGYPPGDYNKDHAVDTGDYIIWRKTFGQTGAGLAADGDWSGKVDRGDLAVLRMNLGTSTGGGANVNDAIPEPTSTVLIFLASLFLSGNTRRR
jgi:hypothetical protein